MKFSGKILVIGLGAVSRCTLPLVLKHLEVDPKNMTVLDFEPLPHRVEWVKSQGITFVQHKITKENMTQTFETYVGSGDLIIDLAWNIGCIDILTWCRAKNVMYINTSVELWDPYEGAADKTPQERTLYHRQMQIAEFKKNWEGDATTAILDHGANPGLVSHFTKAALLDIASRWMSEHPENSDVKEQMQTAISQQQFNMLAMLLSVNVIHISERDTQISNKPKEVNEFVNTWSIEGFYEEGIAPAELGWGTHEKTLPPGAGTHASGPQNQICLAQMGAETWVRSWVPAGPIIGMVIRHGEAYSISHALTVMKDGKAIYRPTVHYAYCPTDSAVASMHELAMRNYNLQKKQRILSDEIVSGEDQLGCLLMGHPYKSWWIGSLLDINEARRLVPGQNATTLQVAASIIGAVSWMIANPKKGVCLPDDLPHEEVLSLAKPYLGPFVSQAVNWTPMDSWSPLFEKFGRARPKDEDMWQFDTFFVT